MAIDSEQDVNVSELHAQLAAWSATLDRADQAGGRRGAVSRVRIDGLRARHTALQSRLSRYEATRTQTWRAFQADVANDWQSLELALEDLSHTTLAPPCRTADPTRPPSK